MGILGDLTGSTSRNGSNNSSWSASNSQSQTYGSIASAQSLANMREANAFEERMLEKTMAYNAEQARLQREWEQRNIDIANQMANTTYSRSVKDMIAAGINPILAAGAGLGGVGNGSVSGGASASVGTPTGHMASSSPDVISSSSGASESEGKSWGSSESGLAVGLQMLGEALGNAISNLNSGSTINNFMQEAGDLAKTTWNDIKGMMIENLPSEVVNALGLNYKTKGPGVQRTKTITGKSSGGGIWGRNGNGTNTPNKFEGGAW